MCKVYGYCRISTAKQSIERQERNIKDVYPDAVILKEAYTGTKITGRKELEKIIKAVKPGDTIVFDSVSRMSRNADEGFKLYQDLFDKGIKLVFLKEHHIDTDTYRGEMDKQISKISTGNASADKFVNGMMKLIKEYTLDLAKEQIKLAFEQSEKEVEDLHQRTREGLVTAKLNGKQVGRSEGDKLTTKKGIKVKEEIRKKSRLIP